MPLCLITNLPSGHTKITYHDDGIRPEKRKQSPECKRITVYGPSLSLVYDSARAQRYGEDAPFDPEDVARYAQELAAIDAEHFL